MADQTTGTTSTRSPSPQSFDDIPFGAGAQPATAENTPFLTRVGYSIANYLDRTGRQAANRSGAFNPSRSSGLTRSPNNNGITTIPDLADINITHSLRRLEDSTTYFTIVPSFGDEESIISRKEVQAAIEYRNTFKSGAPIADYVDFFKSIEQKYFSNQFSLSLEGDPTVGVSLNDFSGFSNDSIFYWIKKYFAFPELTKFLNATNAFYRGTWSRSNFNAIHLKFVLERYRANTKSFFKSFSDSIGLMSNCKYHQLDSTQPIFDVSQDNYGVPIPFSANMENKVGPTARNLMYNLSRYNTTLMRHNLMQIAYYNSAYIKNMKVSSRVAHGCNLVNDIAFFVDFAQKTQTRVETVRTKFNAFNNKLFTFIQYISNIGNRCALNLRDIYAPIDGYDKDFTVTPGSTTIAAQNVNEQTGIAIDAQLNELEQFALADQSISRRLYEDTARLRYLGDTRIIFNGAGSYDKIYGTGGGAVTEPSDLFIGEEPFDPLAIPSDEEPLPDVVPPGSEDNVEPALPGGDGDVVPDVVEEFTPDGSTVFKRADTGEALTEQQAKNYLAARENALAEGKDEYNAGIIAQRTVFNVTQPSQRTGTASNRSPQMNRFLYALGTAESGFNPQTASNPALTNLSNYNKNVAAYGVARGGDFGYFQTNKDQSDWSLKRFGTPLLNTGSVEEQTNSMATYIRNAFPEAATLIDQGNYQAAAQKLYGQWPGIDPSKSVPGLGNTGARGWQRFLTALNADEEKIQSTLRTSEPIAAATLTVSRSSDIEVNQSTATSELQPVSNSPSVSPTSSENVLAEKATENLTITPAQQAAAINYASAASSRPYSNRQRMVPFAFQIRVEDIDGEEKLLTVDYLLKKVVQDNFNFFKRIDTLRAKKAVLDALESSSIDPNSGGQTLDVYRERLSQLAEYEWRNLLSSGNINRVLAAAGVNPASTEYGQLYSVLDSVLKQNTLTSQTLGQGFNALVGLGINRIPTNILGSLTNGASIFDTVIGEINSIGGTPLPTIGGILNSLNPFNYIDINISGLIPQVSLGSLDDIMGLAAGLAEAGPPTSIGDALDLAEQFKNIICEFEIPFISWPVLETLFKLKFNPKDIQKAIEKELREIGERLADLFNPEKILQAIEQQIVSIFTTLYKRLFVCDNKSSTDASGQESVGGSSDVAP